MIIQTGMRTDIPAFYSKWLLNKIKEGVLLVRNRQTWSARTAWAGAMPPFLLMGNILLSGTEL